MPEVQTNYVNVDSKNSAIPKAPDNMSDFMDQAKNFMTKAQASGVSPTAIANTVRFMYDLTQKNADRKDKYMNTPSQQAADDVARGQLGINQQAETRLKSLADQETMDATITGADFGLGGTTQSTPTNDSSSSNFDFENFDKGWSANTTSGSTQPVSTSTNQVTASSPEPAKNPATLWKPAKFSLHPTFEQLKAAYPAPVPVAPVAGPVGPTNAQIAQSDPNSWQAQYAVPAMGSFRL